MVSFGVNDDQTIVGTQFRLAVKDLQSLKREVADKTTNRITFIDIHEIQHSQGRVLIFEIPSAPHGLPIGWSGHYYGRDGESLGPLNFEEIERIRSQNKAEDWSSVVIEEATVEDLDKVAVSLAREKFIKKNARFAGQSKHWDTKTFLNKAKLTINGKITRSAILLLGKQEASHWLNRSKTLIQT